MNKGVINFVLAEMTFLRYFIPLTIEAGKRGIKSKYFLKASGKYNCPWGGENNSELKSLSSKFNFEIHNFSEIPKEGVFFLTRKATPMFLIKR